ncbi:uncharacterized protein CIMG_08446 [Coccidioides immitis RS]|uniref:Mitochondrial zinc maintenance protein 1, mitochondrial n=6 Tax=Coccidioides TaxID=5500 RepID=A0A0E1S189_COCIM|nr:uncharacterized protein CIMG_08446 [Coccidioides immitis RS]XP_003070388.1 hypothetical protein CPC735_061160 [Coccidioides posadasii C735 delta SOWgp]EFW15083.1 conserved hypothetical protein [Coccidioides posadasii str. Silveira]KMM68853.1 hypothetical protein CPAG_05177 [Coccidioides posadasii RMSCC 3488]KMU77067.1 hypothetical protein CISG_06302 [Coccidioides immitis RMSCC 3703]TPX22393.1 Mitochondrial zinc maintenance protein 1, mitochondrial [Coccidioides immitis]EAS29700.1 hypotheti|eukprot:XP_003070388.1 hypothetical protein CPC735_061160 [Coccidioides posadasii C735 delta SOWgp]
MASSVNGMNAYRQLLRAMRIAFEGDFRTYHAARTEARRQFDMNRQLGEGTPALIQNALEVAHILKTNIVQGEKVETTNEKGETVDRYSLRIHEHIERGDNDTVKTAGKEKVKVKPCSK